MQEDFHYYATYAAATLAGYTHEQSLDLAYSAQFVDCCSRTLLTKLKAPAAAATTQLQLEMMDSKMDMIGLQDITRIWASFHFLPADLFAEVPKKAPKDYKNKYRLICNSNGELVIDTVKLAKGSSVQAAGVAMHVLADTWAHKYFAGTPSLVINNTNYHFFEILPDGGERHVHFRPNPKAPDDIERGYFTNTLYQPNESAIMNLGHGRAGHLPDYSYIRYRYLPAWGSYREVIKDNPHDYIHAFAQMIYAMKYLRGEAETFTKHRYDWETVDPLEEEIMAILTKRQPLACAEWKTFGEKLSGQTIEDFDINKYQQEYVLAPKEKKDDTFLGKFILAALAQKSMVTNKIYTSGNMLAGYSVDYKSAGFRGIRDFKKLVEAAQKGLGA